MHPIQLEVPYMEERNRLTVFFRLLLAIPWLIWLSIYGLIAYVAAIGAWFALLFTKRYPEGLYKFIGGYVRTSAQVTGWTMLLVDDFPPFVADDEYDLEVSIAGPQVDYRRPQTFFKMILAFPQQLLLYGLSYAMMAASFVTWGRVLFTGKQSATMHDALVATLVYSVRAGGFLLLLTEVHPRLLDLQRTEYPAGTPSLPGPGQLPAPEGPALGASGALPGQGLAPGADDQQQPGG